MLPPMEVEFEKVVVNGRKMYKFVGARNVLGLSALPQEYVWSGPMVRQNFASNDALVYRYDARVDVYLNLGDYLTVQAFKKFKALLAEAGSRLGKIRLQESLNAWTGKEVLIE